MRWFGEDWGAPVCRIAEKASTPHALCARGCGHEIRHGDIGMLIPVYGSAMRSEYLVLLDNVPHIAYHLVCFFDEIGVRGKTHN